MLSVSKYLQLIEICVIFLLCFCLFFSPDAQKSALIDKEMFLFKGLNIIVWNSFGV